MSTSQIIEELPRLSAAELREIERHISELTNAAASELHAENIGGRLVLAGPRLIRQADVDAILDELP